MKSYLQKISVNRVFLHELKITFWVSCTKYVSAGMCREKWQIPDLLSPGNHNATLLYLQTWQNNVQPPRYGKQKLVKRLKFSSLCKCGKTLTTCHRPGQVASDSVGPLQDTGWPISCGQRTQVRRHISYRASQCLRLMGHTACVVAQRSWLQGRYWLYERQRVWPDTCTTLFTGRTAGQVRLVGKGSWPQQRAALLDLSYLRSVSGGKSIFITPITVVVSWAYMCENL